jgi:hypothetical protein
VFMSQLAQFPRTFLLNSGPPTPSAPESLSLVMVEEVGGYVGEFQPKSARRVIEETCSDHVASQEID